MAVRLKVLDRIRWVPATDQDQIPDYLNCMDVLVLPSLTSPMWKEQFGRVLIEAQACEVPVIGSSSGAIPEVIGNPELIFKEGSVDDLACLLKKMESSIGQRKKLGVLGRRRVLNHFTNKKISDQIHSIYRDLFEK
jgi:glycosyltransferase involved in cell wall biosynthesis